MIFSQEHKIVNCLVPVDGNNTALTTDIISMSKYRHATFIWCFGIANTSAASTTNLIVNKGEDLVTCTTGMAVQGYRAELTANGDTLEALTAMPAAGISIGASGDEDFNTGLNFIVVEVDAENLAPTQANPYSTVNMSVTMADATSCLMSCVCILSEPRYTSASAPTAIA